MNKATLLLIFATQIPWLAPGEPDPTCCPPPEVFARRAARADGWPIDKVEPAIARFVVIDGTCTAFRIHAERWVTASHCLTSGLVGATIQDLPVLETLEDLKGEMGIAVLRTAPSKGPRLKAAFARRGEDVLYVGYGGAAPAITFFPVLVMMEDVEINGEHAQTYSDGAIQGMSGGPTINRAGQVTGVVLGSFQPTAGPQLIGFGPDFARLKRLMEKWD